MSNSIELYLEPMITCFEFILIVYICVHTKYKILTLYWELVILLKIIKEYTIGKINVICEANLNEIEIKTRCRIQNMYFLKFRIKNPIIGTYTKSRLYMHVCDYL